MTLLRLLALASLLTAPLAAAEKLNVGFIMADDLAASRPDLIRQAEDILRREVSDNARFPVPIPRSDHREPRPQAVETLIRPLFNHFIHEP